MRQIILFLVIILFVFSFFNFFPLAIAQYFSNLDATVRISVCGNGVIEGGEDCEGDDLNGATCESLDYPGGDLICDIACSFDITNCWPRPTPTPTPTSTPTPTPTATLAVTSTPTSRPTSTPGPSTTSTPGATSVLMVQPTPLPKNLQTIISLFNIPLSEIQQTGKIEISEFIPVVKEWVSNWNEWSGNPQEDKEKKPSPEKCDLNKDEECDVVDFSVLLYYIEG